MEKPKGIIILGYATCGKSYIGRKYKNVLDLESSPFKWDYSGIKDLNYEKLKGTADRKPNKEWPDNYYKALNEAVQKYDVVLLQLSKIHFDYLDKNKMKYSIAYPNINNVELIERRARERGNNENFITSIKSCLAVKWEEVKKRNYEKLYIIDEDNTLEKALLEDGIELKMG